MFLKQNKIIEYFIRLAKSKGANNSIYLILSKLKIHICLYHILGHNH